MNKWSTFAALLVLQCSLIAQTPEGTQANRAWTDIVRDATVAIGVSRTAKVTDATGQTVEKQIFAPIGTGALFGLPGDSTQVPWLVTAKHVFVDPSQKWDPDIVRLRFAWFGPRSVEDYIGIEIPLKRDGARLWIPHPDPNVDLAAIPLNLSKELAGRDSVDSIPAGNFATAEDLFEGAPILVFGYPGAVGQSFWTRALVRAGVVAWVDPKAPMESPLLIDSLVFPGNSGGPVFRVPTGADKYGNFNVGGRPAFLGIVSQGRRIATPVSAGGQQIEMQGPQGVVNVVAEEWIGIGVIEPAAKVMQLLNAAKATLVVK